MSRGKLKFRHSIREFDRRKENRTHVFPGRLGITINGERLIEVPGRPGYVYVRARYNLSELIQAYNDEVTPIYDLPVTVINSIIGTNQYRIIGRDVGGYTDWGDTPYLAKHGAQHSFGSYQPGADPVWVWGRQIIPLAIAPSGTYNGSSIGYLYPYSFYDDGVWRYLGLTGTPDLLPYKPTGSYARAVLVWLDREGNPQIEPGTTYFSSSGSYEYVVIPSLPPLPQSDGIPLAAIVLTSGTESVTWNDIYDVRQWIHPERGHIIQSSGVDLTQTPRLNFLGGLVAYNSGNTTIVSGTATSAPSTFLSLTDTPDSYVGQENRLVQVNSSGTALQFSPTPFSGFVASSDGAYVSRASSQTFPNATGVAVSFVTENIDNGNYFNPSFPTRLTVQEEGWYQVSGFINWSTNTSGNRLLSIRLNGSETRATTINGASVNNGDVQQSISASLYLSPSNYVELIATQTSGGNLNLESGWMTIVREVAASAEGLGDLSDVEIYSPADNELLAYDSASGTWTNQTPSEAGLDARYVNITGDTLQGDLNFDHYKAIAMACDSGSTLPTSPVSGQWFLYTPVGRKVLMLYDGTSWNPIISFGSYTVYVDPSQGTDSQDKGYSSGTNAYRSIQYAFNQIPGIFNGNVNINVDFSGTIDEGLVLQGKKALGNYRIYIVGKRTIHSSGTATGGDAGSGTTWPSIVDTSKSWTTNEHAGRLVEINGIYRPIESNTSNTLNLVGGLGFAPSGYSYTIFSCATFIDCSTKYAIDVRPYQEVVFKFMRLEGTSYAYWVNAFAYLGLTACQVIDSLVPLGSSQDGGFVEIYSCYLHTVQGPYATRGSSFAVYTTYLKGYGSTTQALRAEVNSIGTMRGSMIYGFSKGSYAHWNGTLVLYSYPSETNNRISSCTYGVYAETGGKVKGTSAITYSGNTTDEYAVSATYGYID